MEAIFSSFFSFLFFFLSYESYPLTKAINEKTPREKEKSSYGLYQPKEYLEI